MNYTNINTPISSLSNYFFDVFTKSTSSIDDLHKQAYSLTKDALVLYLHELDNYILHHENRIKYYKVKGFYNRTIITELGEITYKRRYYISNNPDIRPSGFLLDRLLNIEPYSKLTLKAKEKVVKSVADNLSYRTAGEQAIQGVILSKQTVYNCLCNVEINTKKIKEKLEVPVIYISVDGFFLKQKGKKNKIEVKFANIFTGIEKSGKKRKLINSMIVVRNDHESFLNAINNALNDNFIMNNKPRIIVGGDGARWIKLLANELNAEFCIDAFHFLKVLKQNLDKEEYLEAKDQISKGNYKFYEKYKTKFEVYNNETGELTGFSDEYRFIKNNAKFTSFWNDLAYIGTFAEEVVSHVFNLRMRGVPRTWGRNLNKVLNLLASVDRDNLLITVHSNIDYVTKDINDVILPPLDGTLFQSQKKSYISMINENLPIFELGKLRKFI